MLFKLITVFLFILSLYRRYKVDIKSIGEHTLNKFMRDMKELQKLQGQYLQGIIQGGGSNDPVGDGAGNGDGGNCIIHHSSFIIITIAITINSNTTIIAIHTPLPTPPSPLRNRRHCAVLWVSIPSSPSLSPSPSGNTSTH